MPTVPAIASAEAFGMAQAALASPEVQLSGGGIPGDWPMGVPAAAINSEPVAGFIWNGESGWNCNRHMNST
jgi:hypothetical protein